MAVSLVALVISAELHACVSAQQTLCEAQAADMSLHGVFKPLHEHPIVSTKPCSPHYIGFCDTG